MKGNSIEEDIKRIEYIFEFQNKMSCHYVLETEDEKAIEHILSDYKRLIKENEEWQRAYQEEKDKQFDLIKENKQIKQRLKEQVLIIRDDTIKMYEENEIKLESRITELENVIIQAIDELKNINFYEPRLKNKNQKEVNNAYSILFDVLKTKES